MTPGSIPQSIDAEWLEQAMGPSGGPCSLIPGDSVLDRLPPIGLLPVAGQFSAFVSDPSSSLNSTVEEEVEDDDRLSSRTVAEYFLDASVGVLLISIRFWVLMPSRQ